MKECSRGLHASRGPEGRSNAVGRRRTRIVVEHPLELQPRLRTTGHLEHRPLAGRQGWDSHAEDRPAALAPATGERDGHVLHQLPRRQCPHLRLPRLRRIDLLLEIGRADAPPEQSTSGFTQQLVDPNFGLGTALLELSQHASEALRLLWCWDHQRIQDSDPLLDQSSCGSLASRMRVLQSKPIRIRAWVIVEEPPERAPCHLCAQCRPIALVPSLQDPTPGLVYGPSSA